MLLFPHHTIKSISCGSAGVLLCKIAKLILITVPEPGFKGDERASRSSGKGFGAKNCKTLLGDRDAALRTKIKVDPTPTQESSHAKRGMHLPSEARKLEQQGQTRVYLNCTLWEISVERGDTKITVLHGAKLTDAITLWRQNAAFSSIFFLIWDILTISEDQIWVKRKTDETTNKISGCEMPSCVCICYPCSMTAVTRDLWSLFPQHITINHCQHNYWPLLCIAWDFSPLGSNLCWPQHFRIWFMRPRNVSGRMFQKNGGIHPKYISFAWGASSLFRPDTILLLILLSRGGKFSFVKCLSVDK